MKQATQKFVVIGGGTGTSVVLQGLKEYSIDLTAILTVADSGGSTGRLRDEFGFQAVGDLRQALAALAKNDSQTWIRDVLLYRFDKGTGLEGHNLGNLILTALQDLTGSTPRSLEIAADIFRLKGNIYPSTLKKVDLVVEYTDGSFVIGEHHLNPDEIGGKRIKKIMLSPKASLYSKAKDSLLAADYIIIGPGDLYASIMPNLIVSGMKRTLQKAKGKIVYILNLMTVFTQTYNFTARDHLVVIEKAIGRPIDYCVINNAPFPPEILKAYKSQRDYPVLDDLPDEAPFIRAPLIKPTPVTTNTHDSVKRSFIRHDTYQLAKLLHKLCQL